MRIGIILQDEDSGAITSALSTASALARSDPRLELVVATANARIAGHVRRFDDGAEPWIDLIEFPPARLPRRLLHGPRQVYVDNRAFFASLDILITSDAHARTLTEDLDLPELRIVFADSGEPLSAQHEGEVRQLLVPVPAAKDHAPG
jgi:hypothetical protein